MSAHEKPAERELYQGLGAYPATGESESAVEPPQAGAAGHGGLLPEGGHKVVQRQPHGVPLQRCGAAERRVGRRHLPASHERVCHPRQLARPCRREQDTHRSMTGSP